MIPALIVFAVVALVAGVRMVRRWMRAEVTEYTIVKRNGFVRTPWGWVSEENAEAFMGKKHFVKGARSPLRMKVR
jgi:hypothetical protein